MKIAPLMESFRAQPAIEAMLVHTGQHYDAKMSDLFFGELDIPKPDVNLGVGSGSHAIQTAAIMQAFEPVIEHHKPDAVLVVGDVNSTIACGLVTVKMGVRLIHVEAGLRSHDRSMPEEINRILTDAISDVLFCSESSGVENLRREGIPDCKVHLVGNVMIDTLLRHRKQAEASKILDVLGLSGGAYALVTLHRPSNVDSPAVLGSVFSAIEAIGQDMPVVFPAHPRTRQRLASFRIRTAEDRIRMIDPLGYLDFLKLLSAAFVVLTDSGGIQEETTILNVPCLTLRENTERPVTLQAGTNQLVGANPDRILRSYREVRAHSRPALKPPPLWDGHSAERITRIILGAPSG
jgi:UDP-N-acetylglucosamine 2-epimerase (non-hydrolysing)